MLTSEEKLPTPPPLRRTVTYSDRRSLEPKEIEEIRDLQRRRTESRRGRSRRQGGPRDEKEGGESSESRVAVAMPSHRLSRDGVHYLSPYPSPVDDLTDLTTLCGGGSSGSRRNSIDEAVVSPGPGKTDAVVPDLTTPDVLVRARRTRSPLKNHEDSRYPDYRAVPSTGRETIKTSRNITDDAEALLEQEVAKLAIE